MTSCRSRSCSKGLASQPGCERGGRSESEPARGAPWGLQHARLGGRHGPPIGCDLGALWAGFWCMRVARGAVSESVRLRPSQHSACTAAGGAGSGDGARGVLAAHASGSTRRRRVGSCAGFDASPTFAPSPGPAGWQRKRTSCGSASSTRAKAKCCAHSCSASSRCSSRSRSCDGRWRPRRRSWRRSARCCATST